MYFLSLISFFPFLPNFVSVCFAGRNKSFTCDSYRRNRTFSPLDIFISLCLLKPNQEETSENQFVSVWGLKNVFWDFWVLIISVGRLLETKVSIFPRTLASPLQKKNIFRASRVFVFSKNFIFNIFRKSFQLVTKLRESGNIFLTGRNTSVLCWGHICWNFPMNVGIFTTMQFNEIYCVFCSSPAPFPATSTTAFHCSCWCMWL